MLVIPNYRFHETVFEGAKTQVYRGVREFDNRPVLAKKLKKNNPSELELNWLEYEYRIVKSLGLPCVPEMYDIVQDGGGKILLMEDFGATTLSEFFANGLPDLRSFLQLAIAITNGIGEIHNKNVIHKDIKPGNILINPETLQVKITGFGISAQVNRENQQVVIQDTIEGTLAYISPEQTGRMNRSIDYRSDLYSLGATLYEVLTGSPPFFAHDHRGLIHAQLTRKPEPAHNKRHEIPGVISEIISKLLAKAPEERYQSSSGLVYDFVKCNERLNNQSELPLFPIGQRDLPEKFHPPEKLYGRDKEKEVLETSFNAIVDGEKRMLLIEGPPGIGKTFLIQEIHKPLIEKMGLFISGKFEQYKGHTPYAPIVQAFQGIIKYILTLPQLELDQWKEKIIEALVPNSKIIVDVIPELAAIIGTSPPVTNLGPTEALNRLNRTFQRFFQIFASEDHPFVMFIDDWQWADPATLSLLRAIITDSKLGHFLFIGAYRDTEVSAGHPFFVQLDEIRQNLKSQIEFLKLTPLTESHVIRFVSDALYCELKQAISLGRIIHEKTQGNPFFMKQFLNILYDEGYVWFDRQKGYWRWDIARVREMEVAENVVELLVKQFMSLPEESRKELQLASCIGNQFNLETLSKISDLSQSKSFSHLWKVVAAGYLLPLDTNYKLFWSGNNSGSYITSEFRFAHDKIQQAAYDLAKKEERQPIHLKIGRMLLQNTFPADIATRIFEIVDQFNLAIELLVDQQEKETLARLNLKAALKAKKSAAYSSALKYLHLGCDLLSQNSWKNEYSLTKDLFSERAEIEYLDGNFDESERLIDYLLEHLKTDLEKAEIYNLLIVQKTMSAHFDKAIIAGRNALSLLGIEIALDDLDGAFEDELQDSYKNMRGRDVADLIESPDLTDEERRLQILLLTNICSPAYRSNQPLFRVLVLKAVNISLVYGLVVEACYTFSAYGLLLGSILGDYQTGYKFGLLALNVSQKFKSPTQDCRANFVMSTTLVHWVQHAREADVVSDRCYAIGLDSGEFQFSGYILTYKLTNLIFQGKNLKFLMETADSYLGFVTSTKNRWAQDMILGAQMVLSNLLGVAGNIQEFTHQGKTEKEFFASCEEIKNYSALCRYHIFKAQALYIMGQYHQAREALKDAEQFISFLFGTIYSAEFVFLDSLIMTALLDGAGPQLQAEYLSTIGNNQLKLEVWAQNCEVNFRHRYLIIEAELEKFKGNALEAMDLYENTINEAKQGDFVQNEAIASERAGKFWLQRNKVEIATLYLRRGYQCYKKWGAITKLEQMQHFCAEFDIVLDENIFDEGQVSQETVTLDHLEVETLVKTLQVISGEIVLEGLLGNLMLSVVTDSGADRGVLFLNKKGELLLEAEISQGQESTVLQNLPLEETQVPLSLIRYVQRTHETVVVDDALADPLINKDEYIDSSSPLSILCMPILRQRQLQAILYMENSSVARAFTPKRQKILSLLGAQAAISLENASLFDELHREVVERRRAEDALRRSEERFRELADLLPQIIFEADLDGTLQYINLHGFTAYGYTKERFNVGISVRDIIVSSDHAKLEKNIKAILKGEPVRGNTYRMKSAEGRLIPVIAYSNRIVQNDAVTGFRGIIVDITDLRKAETELKNTRNYLDNLFNTLPSILISVNERGQILKWNSSTEKFTGNSEEEVVGRSVWECLSLLKPFKENFTEVCSTLEPLELYKQQVLQETRKFFDIFMYPLSYEGDRGAVIRIDDVTDSVSKDQQLHHAQKMEIIGSLAGGLAHDFNNLLSGITGTLSLVKVQLDMGSSIPHEKLQSYVSIMESASNRAASLVKQLQMLSKRQPLSLTFFKLSKTVSNVLDIWRNTIDKSIEIETFFNDNEVLVEADQGQVEQVILNICINSAHAMTIMRKSGEKLGGTLKVSVVQNDQHSISLPPHLVSKESEYLFLKVEDTGVGMDRETLARIFDPFFTSKETGVGSGLGLAMAYNIVKQHNGLIDVFSEVGQGTIFTVMLPKAKNVKQISTSMTDTLNLSKGSGLILVIDDEEIVREIAAELLGVIGYRVALAEGGDEGISIYKQRKDDIVAVILDMAMPKKSGKEVYAELKKIDAEVKVVLSSGFRQDRRVEEVMNMGVDAFIQKPYSLIQLMTTLGDVLDSK